MLYTLCSNSYILQLGQLRYHSFNTPFLPFITSPATSYNAMRVIGATQTNRFPVQISVAMVVGYPFRKTARIANLLLPLWLRLGRTGGGYFLCHYCNPPFSFIAFANSADCNLSATANNRSSGIALTSYFGLSLSVEALTPGISILTGASNPNIFARRC